MSFLKNKILKILAITGSIIAVLIIAGILVYNIFGNQIASAILRNILAKNPVPGHVITFDRLSFNILSGNVTVKEITLRPDTLLPDSLIHPPLISMDLAELKIRGVDIRKYLKMKEVDASEIVIEDPVIRLTTFKQAENHSEGLVATANPLQTARPGTDSLSKSKGPSLNFITVGLIRLEGGSFSIQERGSESNSLSVPEVDIDILNVYILLTGDRRPLQDMVHFDDLQVRVISERLPLPGGLYELERGDLLVSYKDSTIVLDSLHLNPLIDKHGFGRKVGKQTDRMDLTLSKIAVKGLDFDRLLLDREIFIRQIDLWGLSLWDFRDKNIPRDYSIFPKLYHQAIKDLAMPMTIDTVFIHNGMVKYEEQNEGAEKSGYVTLENIEGYIAGITNDTAAINRNDKIIVNAEARLMGSGEIKASIILPLNEPNQRFYFSGSLTGMDLTTLNAMTEHNARAIIKSGRIDKAEFSAIADNDHSIGRMRLLYQDLSLEVLKAEKAGVKEKGNVFLTGAADLLLHKENPQKNKPERIGMMSFDRDKNKAIWNYMVKTLFSGALAIAGPGKKNIESDASKHQSLEQRHRDKKKN